MRYRIRHRTSYAYASAVFESFNEVRLQPLACASQTLLDFDLLIEPPATVISFRDYYGNAVHDFGVAYLHDSLVIEATSDVVTHAGADEALAGPREGEPDASPALRELAADVALADELAEFLGPSIVHPARATRRRRSPRTLRDEEPDGSALAFFRRAAAAVRDRLEYRIGTTNVHSSVAEVLAGGERRLPGLRARADLALPPCGPPRPLRERLSRQRRPGRRPRTPGSRRTSRPTDGSASTRRSAPLHGPARQGRGSGATTPTSPSSEAPTRAAVRPSSTSR